MKNKRSKVKGQRWLTRLIICVVFLFTFHFSPFTSCSRDTLCRTPFGEGASIDIYQPDFAALQTVGGTVTINRGYKGIFVRRTTYSDFVAFECACPHCHETRLVPDPDWNGAVLQCPDCHSQFETEYGNPLNGSTTSCTLYEYRTHFDGYILDIY